MTGKNLNMLMKLKKTSRGGVDLSDEREVFALAQRIADHTGDTVTLRDENGVVLATFHPSSVDPH